MGAGLTASVGFDRQDLRLRWREIRRSGGEDRDACKASGPVTIAHFCTQCDGELQSSHFSEKKQQITKKVQVIHTIHSLMHI
jgi:hypothetical protein